MSPAARDAVESFFRPEQPGLVRAVDRIREVDDGPVYDDATTAQLLHGFVSIVHEALGGDSRDARDLYNEGAVELVRSQQRSVGEIAATFVVAGAILADELGRVADAEARNEAVDWLAAFFATWTREIIDRLDA